MNKFISLAIVIGTITPTLASCTSFQDVITFETNKTFKPDQLTPVSSSRSKTNTRPKQTKISTGNSLIAYANNDSCGMFQTKNYPKDYITARHCLKRKFRSDSPVVRSTGQAVILSKPKVGPASIITKHFNKPVQINVKVVEVNQCQAFFVIPRTTKPTLNYIQSGDSGSPVFQYDSKQNPLVIGALSGGLVETKIRDQEESRDAFRAGSMVYDDCNKYK
jgi:hypothetical protein